MQMHLKPQLLIGNCCAITGGIVKWFYAFLPFQEKKKPTQVGHDNNYISSDGYNNKKKPLGIVITLARLAIFPLPDMSQILVWNPQGQIFTGQ